MSSELMTTVQRYDKAKAWLLGPEMQLQIERALPRHVDPLRVAQLFLVEAKKSSKLLECTGESLLGAVMEVSKLGLELGTMGHAWIIPFRVRGTMTATLVVGYKGMLDLAWRSDKISGVYAHAVREGDFFEYAFGSEPFIKHTPTSHNERGNITHAYAGVATTTGGKVLDVMSIEDVEKIRQKSRSKDKGPWVDEYEPMVVKTVMRRALKLAPCSTELARAITLDEAQDAKVDQHLETTLTPINPADAAEDAAYYKCEACGGAVDTESEHYRYDNGKKGDAFRCAECGRRE